MLDDFEVRGVPVTLGIVLATGAQMFFRLAMDGVFW
jgi:hypothetical protein